ncbi:MAG: hypothetical protein JNK30_01845 [Phenylobacterium sp.]|uniref:hypothetical protein n=1 Tax=Phenylobacterium sp. TaxID=1871053 RepID=UPI001A379F45|nr:hypothetical protein [Phenylobacterium sp.]MBL8770097.1 hypothetical protein [Phenylobacterium sp.]
MPHWVWPTALLTVCALAVWRGGDDERLAAGGQLANWALTILLVRANGGTTSDETQWGVLAADVALLSLLLWIALRSRRYWPLFATAFHLLVVLVHFGRIVDPRVSGWAYLTAGLIFAYLVLIAIAYGAWTAPRAERPGS